MRKSSRSSEELVSAQFSLTEVRENLERNIMILIVFPNPEDKGIKVVKESLKRTEGFFEQLQIGKVKNEKARLDKISAKCKKLSRSGKRVDCVLLTRSTLGSSKLKLTFSPKALSDSLAEFIEYQKLSKAKIKPELSELNKTEFPFPLKNLGTFSENVLLLEFGFNKNNLLDIDMRKFQKKQVSEELQTHLKYLKNLLKDLEEHCKRKAASVSRKRSKEISEVSDALSVLEKQLTLSRKPIDAEQDRTKKEQSLVEWRKNGADQMISKFKEIVWPKLAEKSPFTLEEDENIDAAGRSLLIRTSGRILADVFLSGTGEFEIMMRSPMQKMSLITFYEKLCRNDLPPQWKEKFGIR